jgi:hypothetical protein
MNWDWVLKFFETRLKRASRDRIRQLHQNTDTERLLASLKRLSRNLNDTPLGSLDDGTAVRIPDNHLTNFGIVTGGQGSGKTMLAAVQMLRRLEAGKPFGVADPKGEAFNRALYLLAHYKHLWNRVYILDVGDRELASPYNILKPWGDGFDFFIHSRLETLKELLPGQDRLRLRAAGLLKHSLVLLADRGYPITHHDQLFTDISFRRKLVQECRQDETRHYFQKVFPDEPKQTIDSLRARISSLFTSQSLKRALDASDAPDFGRMMDDGYYILINFGGADITRGVRFLLQGLGISDLRQSIFRRTNNDPYLWFMDESQNYFKTAQQAEDLHEILNMGRFKGTFLQMLCQNLSTAITNKDTFEVLRTNLRYTFCLRSSPSDVQFLKPFLPITGKRRKPGQPFQEKQYYSENEERNLLLEEIATLPDRVGYFWLKTELPHAVKMKVTSLEFADDFDTVVQAMKKQFNVGRTPKRSTQQNNDRPMADVLEHMEKRYQEPEEED